MSKPQFGEPWEVQIKPQGNTKHWFITSTSGAVARLYGGYRNGRGPDRAHRIVNCVNACAGLTDEELQRVRAVNELYYAAKLLEKADDFHANDCPECEGETEPPELCGTCFPKFDEARIARRNAIALADEGREP